MKSKLFFIFYLTLISFNASAQYNLLTNEKFCNEIIPKFCADYNLSDSIKIKLLDISLKYISDRESIKQKYFGDNPSPQIISGSPFVIENKELQAKRDSNIEILLGKKTSKDFALYISDYILKKARKAHKEKK